MSLVYRWSLSSALVAVKVGVVLFRQVF